MIRFTRTALVSPGHFADATAIAARVTELLNKRFPDAGMLWGVQVGGPITTLHWTFDVPDLATVEQMMTSLLMDAEYVSLVDSAGAFFASGGGHDTIASLM